jgi:nitrogen-specific signal transduction histidine kinase/CheY-like chemotaxis protein
MESRPARDASEPDPYNPSAIPHERAHEEHALQAQRIEAIAMLASGIAHDFNNILTGILGHAELLLKYVEITDPRRERIQVIVDAAIQGRALTGQLLAYSDGRNLPPGPVNLDSEIGQMEDMLKRLIGENIEVEFQLESEPGSVFSEAGLIYQVVLNLAVNARDAMPDGGRLAVRTSTISIHPDQGETLGIPEGRYALLEMSDSGCGIDSTLQRRLFEPLFSTKPREKHTGLGLYTVYSLVRRIAGHIRVQSEVGCGTTFRIYFPFSNVSPSESYSLAASPLREGRGELVMIVEDDSKVRNILRDELMDLGYSIRCEERGLDAIQTVERLQKNVSLLITDVVMPDLNGPELVRVLRRKRPHLKVLFITGYASDAVLPSDYFPVSEFELLRKPFTREELNVKIRNLLGSKPQL